VALSLSWPIHAPPAQDEHGREAAGSPNTMSGTKVHQTIGSHTAQAQPQGEESNHKKKAMTCLDHSSLVDREQTAGSHELFPIDPNIRHAARQTTTPQRSCEETYFTPQAQLAFKVRVASIRTGLVQQRKRRGTRQSTSETAPAHQDESQSCQHISQGQVSQFYRQGQVHGRRSASPCE
jgi:hypothetical protein